MWRNDDWSSLFIFPHRNDKTGFSHRPFDNQRCFIGFDVGLNISTKSLYLGMDGDLFGVLLRIVPILSCSPLHLRDNMGALLTQVDIGCDKSWEQTQPTV